MEVNLLVDDDEFSELSVLDSLLSEDSLLESLDELCRFFVFFFLSFLDFLLLRDSSLLFDSFKVDGIEPIFKAKRKLKVM